MPLGEEIPLERRHQIEAPPKNPYFTTIYRIAWERLQIDTDLLRIITSTGDYSFPGVPTSITSNPQNRSFYWIFRDFRLRHTFQEWTAPKALEIDQDNLHMKFSELNVDFNSLSFDPLRLRSPSYEGIKFGYPCQNARFLLLSTYLASIRLQIDTDLLLIMTSTADDLSVDTNIDDLERPWNRKWRGFTDFSRFQAATHI